MRKILFVLGSVLVLASCGPSQGDAVKYNDQIVGLQKALLPLHEGFIAQIDGHNLDSLKILHELFAVKAKSTLAECEKLPGFGGNRDYANAAAAYFKVLGSLADKEGTSLVNILTKDSSQMTDKDVYDVTTLAAKFDSEYARALQKIQDAQMTFSKEWKFELKGE
jgi:hypothetical protein